MPPLIRVLVASIALFVIHPALAAEVTYSKTYSQCLEAAGGATFPMIDCMTAETALWDKQLNATYRKLMATLAPARQKVLADAEKLWLQYRNANCDFIDDPDGGSAARISANGCVLHMTAERTLELASFIEPDAPSSDAPTVDQNAAPPAPSESVAFRQGVADRSDWETWFAGTRGDYHDGAIYWSGQRSLAQPGSCANQAMSRDWQAGCVEAQKRLAMPDGRRRSEPDYRRGWNSWSPHATTQPIAPQQAISTPTPIVEPPRSTPSPPLPSAPAPRATESIAAPPVRGGRIPIEPDARFPDEWQDKLQSVQELAQIIVASNYVCDSISGGRPFVFSHGYEILCNNFSYKYEINDRGGHLIVTPD